jgi:hypothetical protein
VERLVLQLPGAAAEQPGRLVLYHFGPDGHGTTAGNVARWTAQFKDAEGASAAGATRTLTVGPYQVTVLEVQGTYYPGTPGLPPLEEVALWAAIVEGPGGPYYLKAMAPIPVLARHRARLQDLAATLRQYRE